MGGTLSDLSARGRTHGVDLDKKSWQVVETNVCLPDFFSLFFFSIGTMVVTKVVPGVCF